MSENLLPKTDKTAGASASPEDQPREGYDDWLTDEIANGTRELDQGKALPAERVWTELGLE